MENDLGLTDLTLGVYLTVLRRLGLSLYRAQAQWFATLFRSYHKDYGDAHQIDYQTAPPRVSHILNGKDGLPRPMYIYYTVHDDLLQQDIADYLDTVVGSARQREVYMITLLNLLESSNNLLPEDREYIKGYAATAKEGQLAALVYRMMSILIREPLDKSA